MTRRIHREAASRIVRNPASDQSGHRRAVDRRRFGILLTGLAGSVALGWSVLKPERMLGSAGSKWPAGPETAKTLFDQAVDEVLPPGGRESRIALKNSVIKLVEHGVIDQKKFLAVYQAPTSQPQRSNVDLSERLQQEVLDPEALLFDSPHDDLGLTPEMRYLLRWPSNEPMRLSQENASYYVNLLWPLGLANRMTANDDSPLSGSSLPNFASTGGWTLGKEDNGAAYFNKFAIVELTAEQEALVVRIAKGTYRPCCNNSTFFQDCNHGSALLGLLQLGASQGLTEQDLYREALLFNSFWFPMQYVQTALYFKVIEGVDWANVDPATVMGFRYSALGPWQQRVAAQLAKIPDLIPERPRDADCGL